MLQNPSFFIFGDLLPSAIDFVFNSSMIEKETNPMISFISRMKLATELVVNDLSLYFTRVCLRLVLSRFDIFPYFIA